MALRGILHRASGIWHFPEALLLLFCSAVATPVTACAAITANIANTDTGTGNLESGSQADYSILNLLINTAITAKY